MAPRWRAAPPPAGFLRGISRRVNINQSRPCLSRDSERQRRSHSSLAGMSATIKKVKRPYRQQWLTGRGPTCQIPEDRRHTGDRPQEVLTCISNLFHRLSSTSFIPPQLAENISLRSERKVGAQAANHDAGVSHSKTRAPLNSTPLHVLIMLAQAKNSSCVSSSDWSPVE